MIAIHSLQGWKFGNVIDNFYFRKLNLTQQNKKSVRKAAYFYRMLKKLSNTEKINHGHGQINGKKTYV